MRWSLELRLVLLPGPLVSGTERVFGYSKSNKPLLRALRCLLPRERLMLWEVIWSSALGI